MKRRELLKTIPAIALASGFASNAETKHSRLRPGIVAYSFRKQFESKSMTYDDLIHLAADAGLDGIDTTVYWFPETSPSFLASLRKTAYQNSVQLYSLACRVRLCQPTPELQDKEVAECRKWVDAAERVGAGHVRVFGGPVPKGASEDQAIGWAAEVLKRSAEYAGSKGITLGVEDDGGLTTTAEPTVEIAKRVNSPFAGINLDTGNFPRNGYSQVALCLPYATSVHFKVNISDENGKKQKADWARLAEMFRSSGYKGYLSLEYEETGDATTAVPPLLVDLVKVTSQASKAS
jgi:L-ribulose-5-phosphate 3-epimerase